MNDTQSTLDNITMEYHYTILTPEGHCLYLIVNNYVKLYSITYIKHNDLPSGAKRVTFSQFVGTQQKLANSHYENISVCK